MRDQRSCSPMVKKIGPAQSQPFATWLNSHHLRVYLQRKKPGSLLTQQCSTIPFPNAAFRSICVFHVMFQSLFPIQSIDFIVWILRKKWEITIFYIWIGIFFLLNFFFSRKVQPVATSTWLRAHHSGQGPVVSRHHLAWDVSFWTTLTGSPNVQHGEAYTDH